MYLFSDNQLFVHIRKTGGIWVKTVISILGFTGYEPERHPSLSRLREILGSSLNSFRTFSLVRKPETWYESYWRYHYYYMQGLAIFRDDENYPWRPNKGGVPIIRNSFTGFIQDCLEHCPGHLTRVYQSYLGENFSELNYVGRMEDLPFSLHEYLVTQGIFSNVAIKTPPVNRSTEGEISWNEDFKRALVNSEQAIYDHFNY